MKTKKFLALLLSLVLVLSSIPAAFAASIPSLTVEADTKEAMPGKTINFTVYLNGADAIEGGVFGVDCWISIPEGLTYEAKSLKKTDEISVWQGDPSDATLGGTFYTTIGSGNEVTAAKVALLTFSCTVDADANGTLSVGVDKDSEIAVYGLNDDYYLEDGNVDLPTLTLTVHEHNFEYPWGGDRYDFDDETHWLLCDCGYTTEPEKHDLIVTGTPATCYMEGNEFSRCSKCDYQHMETIPMIDHVDADGDWKCDVCEEVLCEHDWTDATCTTPKTCKNCGTTDGDALGHAEETLEGKAATCTEDGLTEGKKCSRCEEILVAQEVIKALGHAEEVLEGKAATCTEAGLTEGKKCSRCEEILVAQEVIKALGHDWEITSETDDEVNFKCKACGAEMTETKNSNTEIDVAPDGSVIITTTNEDGTVTTETRKDGVTTTVTTDANGEVISVDVTISSRVTEAAAKNGEAVELNIDAMVADEDLTVTINTNSDEAVAVEVPVVNVTPGCVIVIVDAEGNETVVADTKMTEDGLVFDCPDGATIKVVDNSKSFADIKGENWYNDAIDFVSARGIMTGMTANTFAQNGVTTRAQLWTMLARLSGVDTTCTEGNWYDVARAWAMENGISDGTNADGELTREMLVTMLFRFVGETGESKSIEGFSDAASASDWAKAALEWAYGEGVMNGNADGTMNPNGETTRAQMAQFFMNFIQNI